jgi:RimJ/RimL family protein N-acetyltransferase
MDMPTVQTERLVLRPFSHEHITPAYLGWLNDPQVTRYSNQRFIEHTPKSAGQYLASFAKSPHFFMAIHGRDDDLHLGTMTAYRDLNHGTADLGILIGEPSQWGKGLGLEAWSGLMEYLLGEGGMRKVTGGALDANHAMVKIFEKSGMEFEGRRIRQEALEGEFRDLVFYGKFAS